MWNPKGPDAAYIYKLLISSGNTLDFKTFIKNHRDWEERYDKRRLGDNFRNCKKRYEDWKKGACKYNNINSFIQVLHQIKL